LKTKAFFSYLSRVEFFRDLRRAHSFFFPCFQDSQAGRPFLVATFLSVFGNPRSLVVLTFQTTTSRTLMSSLDANLFLAANKGKKIHRPLPLSPIFQVENFPPSRIFSFLLSRRFFTYFSSCHLRWLRWSCPPSPPPRHPKMVGGETLDSGFPTFSTRHFPNNLSHARPISPRPRDKALLPQAFPLPREKVLDLPLKLPSPSPPHRPFPPAFFLKGM